MYNIYIENWLYIYHRLGIYNRFDLSSPHDLIHTELNIMFEKNLSITLFIFMYILSASIQLYPILYT